jgi:hypothetical protein
MNILRLIPVFFLLLIVTCSQLPAQTNTISNPATPWFFSMNYRTGENRPHRPIIKNLTYPYRGLDLKLGWQSIGKQQWQQAYRYPSYGVGLNWNTFKTEVLGDPVAVYFFTNFPQFTTPWARLDLEIDLGLSYGIHPYDPVNNPNNFSTGSAVNAFFGLYLEQSFHLGKYADLFISEGFTHYSNGALGWPNLGLNIPTLKAGLRFHPRQEPVLEKQFSNDFKGYWQLTTNLSAGIKTLWAPQPLYHEYLIAPTLYYRPSYKRRVGLGFELAYNEAVHGVWDKRNYTGTQLLTYAVYAAHEFVIERFTVVAQFGIYLYNMPSDKFYFERIGLGYYLTDHTRLVLNLKAHYFKAEYVETGLVFDINFK